MANHVYIATSLDGYIARRNHSLDWLDELSNPENDDFGYASFMLGIDALVMGRNTFDKILSFNEWPFNKPVFIVSNSLKNIPTDLQGKAKIINGTVTEMLDEIHQSGYKELYIDGGQTISTFLAEDKIDEMTITRVPRLLGDGIRLFDFIGIDLQFEHVETISYSNGLIKSYYKRLRKGSA